MGSSSPRCGSRWWRRRASPQAIAERINAETNKLLADAEFRVRILGLGAAPMGGSAADYRKLYDEEWTRWAEVVKASGAKID